MWMVKMRNQGVAINKTALFTHRHAVYQGACTVRNAQDTYTKRTMMMAQFFPVVRSGRIEVLYDVHLLWMEPERFMLTGIERSSNGYSEVEFAQSWLVSAQPFTRDDDDWNPPKSFAPPRTPSLETVK